MTDHFGIIGESGLHLAPEELLRIAGLRYFAVSHLDQAQEMYGLTAQVRDSGLVTEPGDAGEAWEDLLRDRKAVVKDTLRLERQIQQTCGPLTFRFAEGQWERHLEHLVKFKSRQYLTTGRRDLFADEWRARLLGILAASRETSCSGILSTLYAGRTWLASHFGLRSKTVLHHWFPVYNPEFKRYSPGRLLLKALISAAGQAGIRVIDHGVGTAQYKQLCATSIQQYFRGEWYIPGVRSVVFRALRSAEWRLDRWREMGTRPAVLGSSCLKNI